MRWWHARLESFCANETQTQTTQTEVTTAVVAASCAAASTLAGPSGEHACTAVRLAYPSLLTCMALSTTVSASAKSNGMNCSTRPSSTSVWDQLQGAGQATDQLVQ